VGYLTIPQATAWISFGDELHELPANGESIEDVALDQIIATAHREEIDERHPFNRDPLRAAVDNMVVNLTRSPEKIKSIEAIRRMRELQATAEQTLIGYLQARQIVALGRPQDTGSPLAARHVEIPYADLLGDVMLGSRVPPGWQSWLFARDPSVGVTEGAWRDVLIPEVELKGLHPTPLVSATTIGNGTVATSAHPTGSRDEKAQALRPAPVSEILRVISVVYACAKLQGMKPPNVREICEPVRRRLNKVGFDAALSHIQRHAGDKRFKDHKLPVGRKRGNLRDFEDLED
jgi:hypothetical protein